MNVDELAELAQTYRDEEAPIRREVRVCMAASCQSSGAVPVHDALEKACADRGASCKVKGVGCMGLCSAGPLVAVADHGADLAHVLLSHVDKVVDRGYQRDIAATGARVEYDQAFRWPAGDANGTLQLLEWAAEDGLLDHITLGLDAARQGYWSQYGGWPGWTYLLAEFADAMRERGLGEAEQRILFVEVPGAAYTFGARA